MKMKIGFTGTRDDMTLWQRNTFRDLIIELSAGEELEFHQGCCLGADATATSLVAEHTKSKILAYPCTIKSMTDANALKVSQTVQVIKPPLDRNKDIVNASDILIACPNGPEVLRSGTWSTVRYARKQNKRIIIIWPDGTITKENHE